MRRKSPPKSTANVALFPFLAVLLCTMGALILLLVVIARQAQQQAAALAAGPSDQQKAAQETLEDLEWTAARLRESRDKTSAQLAEERMKLSHIEDHTRRLRDQLAELASAADKLQQNDQLDQKGRDLKRDELAKLNAKVAKAKSDLENALAANKGTTEAYAIIPFAGKNGTRRRPIYIECRADAIILQPEGIVLSEEDFTLAASPANPLAASLRAAREYLTRKSRYGDNTDEPYPLLLVRPNGIGAYWAAREAMLSWGDEFGYELIDEDWKLDFPPSDVGLESCLKLAINESRRQQARLVQQAPRLYRGGTGPSFQAPTEKGGPVRTAGSRSDERPGLASRGGKRGSGTDDPNDPTPNNRADDSANARYSVNPYASITRGGANGGGMSPGGAGSPPGNGIMPSSAAAGQYAAASPYGAPGATGPYGTSGQNGLNGPNGMPGGAARPNGLASSSAGFSSSGGAANGLGASNGTGNYGGANGPGGPNGTPGATGAGSGGMPGAAGGVPGGTGGPGAGPGFAGQGGGPSLGAAGNLPNGPGGGAETGAGSGGPGNGGSASGSAGSGGPGSGSGGSGGGKPGSSGTGQPPSGSAGSTGLGSTTPNNQGLNLTMGGGQGEDPANQNNGAAQNAADKNALASAGTPAGTSNWGRNRPNPNATAAAASAPDSQQTQPGLWRPGATSGSGLAGGAQESRTLGNTQSSSGQAHKGGSQGGTNAAGGKTPSGASMGHPGSEDEGTTKRRKNWGLRGATHAVAVSRPILLECHADHLTIVPDRPGSRPGKVVPLEPRTSDSVDELVSGVWEQIDTWGIAGNNMYWKPTLAVQVFPGGEKRYADLQSLLADSGLDLKQRAAPIAPPRPPAAVPVVMPRTPTGLPFAYPKTRTPN
jgi:hypothetical protein